MRAIVGFDPGVTSGVAVIGLDGRILYLGSFRGEGVEQIAARVLKVAKPLIVATDVSPTPDSVLKFARSFGAVVFSPAISLTVQDKQDLTSGISLDDLHQRDSLAAALVAYRAYRPFIEKAIQKSGPKYEEVVEKILTGQSSKISSAIAEPVEAKLSTIKPRDFLRSYKTLKLNRDRLARKLSQSEEEIKSLRGKLIAMQSELDELRSKKFVEVMASQKIRQLKSRTAAMEANQRVLFQRVQKAEQMLADVEKWMGDKPGRLITVEREGPGFRVGRVYLNEEPRSKLERIIQEHRARRP